MHEKKCYNNHQNFQLSWKGCARATSKSFSKRNSSGEHKKKTGRLQKNFETFFLGAGHRIQLSNE